MQHHVKLSVFLVLILTIYTTTTHAQNEEKRRPSWAHYETRKARYPASTYVKGFSSAEYRENEPRGDFMNRLKGHARSRLAESIQVEIKSMTTTNMVTENQVTSNYFKQTSLSMAEVKVTGLKTETFFDEEKNEGFAFAFAKRAAITDNYLNQLDLDIAQTAGHLNDAQSFRQQDNTKKALKHYFAGLQKLGTIQEAHGLLMSLNQWNYEHSALRMDTVNSLHQQIEDGIAGIQQSSALTLDGLSYFLAHGLALQMTGLHKPVYISPITFEDKGVASHMSKRLMMQLERDLNEQGIKVTTSNKRFTNQRKEHFLLKGTYWEEKDQLKVILAVKNPAQGQTIASAEGKLPLKWLQENDIAYLPENYQKLQDDLQALNKNEMVSSGLHVALTTNKGNNNPVFSRGDTLELYVKANKPCYLRFIYHLADGARVLMLDNQYINGNKVNELVRIPDKFVIAAPFGGEIMQLNAQTEPFKPLQTSEYGHYRRIQDDMDKILKNVRGFKPVNDKGGRDETHVTLTTLQ